MSPAKNFMMTGASPPRRPPAPALTPARARAGLMLWMTGSGINIFTIMFTGMAMINPLKSIAGVHTQFARFSDNGKVDLTQQKFQFVALNLVCLGVALYKVRRHTPGPAPPLRPTPRPAPPQCQGMGLLPTTVSDWATFETVSRVRAPPSAPCHPAPSPRLAARRSRPALGASVALPPSSRAGGHAAQPAHYSSGSYT